MTINTGKYINIESNPIEDVILFLQDLQKEYPKSWMEIDENSIELYWKREETDEEYEERLKFEKKLFEGGKANAPQRIKLLENEIKLIKEKYNLE